MDEHTHDRITVRRAPSFAGAGA